MEEHSNHILFKEDEALPFEDPNEVANGAEALIDEVTVNGRYEGYPFVCMRRTYRLKNCRVSFLAKNFYREVGILKRLSKEKHVIEMLGSYQKGSEFGILHQPRAHCNLYTLLEQSERERQSIMSDIDLEKGLGCLAAALYTVHDAKIRHKDIKPMNILVYNGSLLLADFGCSNDFSDMNHSQTSGCEVGTRKYFAPELQEGRSRGCATDVFALGCVFLEIISVLYGFQTKEEESFALLAPYRYHLQLIKGWIERRQASSSATSQVRNFWLEASQLMVETNASFRPRMSNVILQMKSWLDKMPEARPAMACNECVETKIMTIAQARIEELKNAHFVWEIKKEKLLRSPKPPAEKLPNSNSGFTYGSNKHVGVLRSLSYTLSDLVTQWKLTMYLDNGRPLRCYGKVPASLNFEYDFQELGVKRIVFESGTFVNEVDFFREPNWDQKGQGHCFRTGPCDRELDEPLYIQSYKVLWR